MAKRKKLQDQNPPRRVEIRGQDHLLAYITPEEAQMLMDNGGAGKPGPMGIPAFYGDGGLGGDDVGDGTESDGMGDQTGGGGSADDGGFTGDDTGQGFSSGTYGGGGYSGYSGDDVEASYGTVDAGPSGYEGGFDTIGRAAEKDFGTPDPTQDEISSARGFDTGTQASRDVIMSIGQLSEIDALEQLNRDLYDLSRREARAKSLPGILGLIAAKNVRNLASSLVGYQPGLLDGLNVYSGNTIGPGLDPGTLAGLQSRGIRGATGKDPFGRETTGIVGFRDEYGNVAYGRDPNEDATSGGDGYGDGYDDRPQIVPVNPATGQCDAGYMFDEDMQACRLDTGGISGVGGTGDTFAPGAYARMGLLDVAPTGLSDFYNQYGIPSQDFDEANLAFRRGTATQAGIFQDPYDLTGYTLLG